MKKFNLNLQFFGEGTGAGASTGAGDGVGGVEGNAADNVSEVAAPKTGRRGRSNPLADVVYGKASEAEGNTDTSGDTPESFEDMIRKGGKYHDDFSKKTQEIINKRFSETKSLQESLEKQAPILSMLADKYGVDATDVDALTKAIEEDETFYEQEAMERGLSVEQLKELKSLERQNAAFKHAEEEAERKANSERIYAEWQQQAEELVAKYGIDNFNLEDEVLNPEFTNLLASGISVESAYKAIHFDDMVGGAMAATAKNVREKMAQSLAERHARPSENGVTPQSSRIFKTDVSALTKADRAEIARRASEGENISF